MNEELSLLADVSPDGIVRSVCKTLEEFEYTEAIRSRYFWKYLSDESFNTICNKPEISVRVYNRTLFSHLLRVIEAFEMASIWRARDLIGSCVDSLNGERLISAATLARSLIELVVTYGDAANYLKAAFDLFDWTKIDDFLFVPVVKDESGKEVNLELFIERLMSGTRMPNLLGDTENMIQRNILTIIQKTDRKLFEKYSYKIMPHYEFLCELAHPNTIGFQRYISSLTRLSNGWENRLMEEESKSERSIDIAHQCLWALSFAAGSMDGVFGVFQELKRNIHKQIGRPLPH